MQKYKYIKSMFAISTYTVVDNQRLQILLCLNEGNLSKTDLKFLDGLETSENDFFRIFPMPFWGLPKFWQFSDQFSTSSCSKSAFILSKMV